MQKNQWIHFFVASFSIAISPLAWSQPTPAQLQMQQQQQINNMLGEVQTQENLQSQGYISQQRDAARQRVWQAREDAILRKIAQYRSTPYYGSFAISPSHGGLYWSGGGKISAELSQKQALALCGHADCKILKTFSNACAAVSWPSNGQEIFTTVDKDPNLAGQKSLEICNSKYGNGNCKISIYKEKNSYAYCSGYDYGAYNQR